MKIVRWVSLKRNLIPILLSVLIIAIVGLSLISVPVAASPIGTWMPTTNYPTPSDSQSCVVSGGYVYCVGGYIALGAVYFAKLSSSGVGAWKKTTSYPTPITVQSCVASGGYIYCVAGINNIGTTDFVYFAPLSSAGVGTWKSTKSYPTKIGLQSCVVSGGYVYCVGGLTATTSSSATNAVYFASLHSSGVSTWTKTTNYPTTISSQSCAFSGGYVYCVGGESTTGFTSAVYFAKLSSSGVSVWESTTRYLTTVGALSCVVGAQYTTPQLFCVGGHSTTGFTSAVYFASLSSSGVGTWRTYTSYPTTISSQSCVFAKVPGTVPLGYMYCVAGYTMGADISAVYFSLVTVT